MDLYVADGLFKPLSIIDDYHEFIWTDRYFKYGDVKLTLSKSSQNSPFLVPGRYLTFDESDKQMVIETVMEDANTGLLKVAGRSLESMFERRLNRIAWDSSEPVTQAASGAMQQSFEQNILGSGFKNTINGNHYMPWGGGPEGKRLKTARTAYDEISTIAEEANLGWKFFYKDGYEKAGTTYTNKLVFETNMGSDRSVQGSANHRVVFDADLDNITDISILQSDLGYKNDAWGIDVYNPETSKFSHLVDYSDTSPFGTEAREIYFDFDMSQYSGLPIGTVWRIIRGMAKEELARNKKEHYIDGRLLGGGPYEYGWHYGMGDLVTIGQDPETRRNARIVEYIWSYNQNGKTEYPTFKVTGE